MVLQQDGPWQQPVLQIMGAIRCLCEIYTMAMLYNPKIIIEVGLVQPRGPQAASKNSSAILSAYLREMESKMSADDDGNFC